MIDIKSKIGWLTTEKISLVIAACAIFVSAASFYATFLQADAAKKQVKAMTMPLIQFDHGNYDPELDQRVISFTLKNAGVGPAVIKSVGLAYRDKTYNNMDTFFKACCEKEYSAYQHYIAKLDAQKESILKGGLQTRNLTEIIIPGQSEYKFLKVHFHENSRKFWEKLDQVRWNLDLSACYCSLLDDCFIFKERGVVKEVTSCPAK